MIALAAVAALAAGAADKPDAPGSYCPLPEGDAPPVCLDPAQAEYSPFFRGLETGQLDPAAAGRVEADLRSERRYQALSSLAYAYYLLSRRAAAGAEPDPEIRARLERWTDLFGETWRATEADPQFRSALREAATDLERRAPVLLLRCTDPDGRMRECKSTAELAAAMTDRDQIGVRGAIGRLFDRVFGPAASAP